MKFYSEVTGELYDDIKDLDRAEAEASKKDLLEEENILKIIEIINEIVAKQEEVIDLASQIAEMTDDKFNVPGFVVYPDGSVNVTMVDEAKEKEEVSKNECKHHCDTDAKSVTHGFKETPQVDDDIKVLMDVLKSLRSF